MKKSDGSNTCGILNVRRLVELITGFCGETLGDKLTILTGPANQASLREVLPFHMIVTSSDEVTYSPLLIVNGNLDNLAELMLRSMYTIVVSPEVPQNLD